MYNSNCFGRWYTRRQLNKVHAKLPNGHSSTTTLTYGDISVTVIPQNSDNYSYMITCEATDDCVVIDVGDAQPVLHCLSEWKRSPQAVLVTHKHWDHCYGNKVLKKHYKELNIYGGEIDRPAGANRYIRHKTVINIGRLHFKALHVPGHTAGHMIYALQLTDDLKCLFTGDFLFAAGVGHEYAKLNLSFAISLEKDNEALKAMNETAHEKRAIRLPIVPVILGDESRINPYLRTNSLKFRKTLVAAGYDVPVKGKREMDSSGGDDNGNDEVMDNSLGAQIAVFDALKKAKNNFTEELIKQMEQKRHKQESK